MPQIYVDEQNSIKFMVCECPRGGLKCNHAAALLIHDIRNLSRTETEYQWGKRKTSTFKSLLAVEELFPPTKKYATLSRKANSANLAALYQDLNG